MRELILIRGLPGSGKTTLAKLIYDLAEGDVARDIRHFETDDYFCRRDDSFWKGKGFYQVWRDQYKFNPKELQEAHHWMQKTVREAFEHGDKYMVLIVSNTFTRIWEMQPYLAMAKEFGAKVTVITCEGQHGNVHGVPEEKIQEMKRRWEPYV